MTSSLRNSLHRRNHKERSQLSHRAKFGLLEKHADYVKRARDYHSKQDRLHRLKQKAAERNKDEFYFSMTKEKTQGGVHVKSRGNVALPNDIVKVLKTQDENYVRTMRASGLKKIDKIKNNLTQMADLLKTDLDKDDLEGELDDGELQILRDSKILKGFSRSHGRKRKHILFAETFDEVSQLSQKSKGKEVAANSPLTETSQIDEDLGWKSSEPKKKSKKLSIGIPKGKILEAELSEDSRQQSLDKRKRLFKELSARLDRDRKLRYAEREFEMQRQLMGKGGRKKIQAMEKVEGQEDEEENEDEVDARRGKRRSAPRLVDEDTYRPRVYKWRLERKR